MCNRAQPLEHECESHHQTLRGLVLIINSPSIVCYNTWGFPGMIFVEEAYHFVFKHTVDEKSL